MRRPQWWLLLLDEDEDSLDSDDSEDSDDSLSVDSDEEEDELGQTSVEEDEEELGHTSEEVDELLLKLGGTTQPCSGAIGIGIGHGLTSVIWIEGS